MAKETKTNIAELLKDCPRGTKVWSRLHNEYLIFWSIIDAECCILLKDSKKRNCYFTPYGLPSELWHYRDTFDECLIFPSEDADSWDKFPPKPIFAKSDYKVILSCDEFGFSNYEVMRKDIPISPAFDELQMVAEMLGDAKQIVDEYIKRIGTITEDRVTI